MFIANPIYDSVFKYLMDDNKVARLLLSAIIGKKIVSLDYKTTDIHVESVPGVPPIMEIDFAAKICDSDGSHKVVIIEIQKAKLPTDIMRFRKYLGEQYASNNNTLNVSEPAAPYGTPLPILSIYFLGYPLKSIKAPVVKVERGYYDLTSGNKIEQSDEFIECLTHDSFIIQIPYLTGKRQTELLQLLSIFDQSNRQEDYHILNVREEDFPVKYRPVIRRLLRAYADPQTRKKMTAEDRHLENLLNLHRTIDKKNKELEEKDKELEEKDKALEEKDKALYNATKIMLQSGISIKNIMQSTGLTQREIESLE